MVGTWLGECCYQVEAEGVSNSRNKIHQTWERPNSGVLYLPLPLGNHFGLDIREGILQWNMLF